MAGTLGRRGENPFGEPRLPISLCSDAVSAIITMAVTIAIAFLVDRLVIGRGGRVAARIGDGGVSRAAQTRLRVIRRLVFVTILLIGAALALSRFAKLQPPRDRASSRRARS